jgi:hypothetical protein
MKTAISIVLIFCTYTAHACESKPLENKNSGITQEQRAASIYRPNTKEAQKEKQKRLTQQRAIDRQRKEQSFHS